MLLFFQFLWLIFELNFHQTRSIVNFLEFLFSNFYFCFTLLISAWFFKNCLLSKRTEAHTPPSFPIHFLILIFAFKWQPLNGSERRVKRHYPTFPDASRIRMLPPSTQNPEKGRAFRERPPFHRLEAGLFPIKKAYSPMTHSFAQRQRESIFLFTLAYYPINTVRLLGTIHCVSIFLFALTYARGFIICFLDLVNSLARYYINNLFSSTIYCLVLSKFLVYLLLFHKNFVFHKLVLAEENDTYIVHFINYCVEDCWIWFRLTLLKLLYAFCRFLSSLSHLGTSTHIESSILFSQKLTKVRLEFIICSCMLY
eukprot:gene5823-4150_t